MSIVPSLFFLVCIVLLLIVVIVRLFDTALGGLDFSTSRNAVIFVSKIIKQFHKEEEILYDLGSARGNFVFKIKKQCPKLKVYGVDNSGLRVFFSKCKAKFFPGPVFIKKDLFLTNLALVDVIYIYLDKSLLPELEEKLLKEMKIGSIVIVNAHPFPSWKPIFTVVTNQLNPTIQKLFVYEKI